MWFTFSLISVLAWAGSDVFSKLGTNKNKEYNHLRLVIMVGLVMGAHAIIYIILNKINFSPLSILIYLPVSFMYIASMVLGYVGLRYIALSISSPICNSSGAFAALLCFLFLGQTMTWIQLLAVAAITLGIVALAVVENKEERIRPQQRSANLKAGIIALIFPILYCVIDGLATFTDAFFLDVLLNEDEANLAYEFTFLIAAVFSLLYLLLIKKYRFSLWRERWFSLGALCETAGQFTYVRALADDAIVAAPMIASYSIFSVLLSHIFLKEKLKKWQYPIIAIVLAGIVILGIEDNS